MNRTQLQWQLGKLDSRRLYDVVLCSELEKLRDAKPIVYSHRKASFPIGTTSLDFDSTGQFLLSSGEDGSLALWALDEGHSEGKLVNKRIQFAAGESKESVNPSSRRVHVTARSPGGKAPRFLTSVESRPPDSLQGPREASHAFSVTSVKWYGPDNGLFFTGSNDHKVKIWDTNTFQVASSIDIAHRVAQLDTLGDLLAVASEDSHPRLIDLRSMSAAISLGVKRSDMRHGINAAKFSHTSSGAKPLLLATGDDDGNVRVWDLRMGNRWLCDLTEADTLSKSHARCCNDLRWDPSGSLRLVTTGNDGKCKMWDLHEGGAKPQLVRQLGATDLTSNRFRRRTSHYLMWQGPYVFFNSDHGEILVYQSHSGLLWHAFEYPLRVAQPERLRSTPKLQSMAIQTRLANTLGVRLVLGTDNTHGRILEYRV